MADQLRWAPNGRNVTFHPKFGGRWTPEPRMPDGRRYPTMGFAAAAWITAKCGLQLDPWQVEILRRGFLYYPDSLDWVVEDVLIVGPEGIGKSAFLAGLALWLLEGPCMPPVEKPAPHQRPNIPVVSAALTLTEHIHRHAKHYIERDGSPLTDRLVVENTKIFRVGNELHRIAFPAGSGSYQQGAEPVPAIIEEELHVLGALGVKETGAEAVKIISSKRMKNARPKVQRWTITNPDDGDPDSLLGQRWSYAARVLEGEREDPALLAIHYHAAQPIELGDPAADDYDPSILRRGIAEATPSSWVDPETIARKYEKGEQSKAWTMRFSLGLFYAGDDQVLPDGALESLAVDPELRVPPPPDVPVALAFDGARNRDSIALTGCTPDAYGFTVGCWERPADAGEGWRYNKLEVHEAVVRAMEVDHPLALLAVDPTWFEDFVYGWQGVDESGRVVEFVGWLDRWPGRVVLDVQQHGAQAWAQFRRAVTEGTYRWDGDPRMVRHMRNAREVTRTHQGRRYSTLSKKVDDGNHPIDLLVTATYALRLASSLDQADTTEADLDAWRQALTGST